MRLLVSSYLQSKRLNQSCKKRSIVVIVFERVKDLSVDLDEVVKRY